MTVSSQSPCYHPGMAYTIRDGSEISRPVENSQYPQHTMGPHHTPVYVYTARTRTSHVQDNQPPTQRKRAQNNTRNGRAFPATLGDLNVDQDERMYKSTPDIFGGQELQMFDQQTMNRGGFDNLNRELLPSPEFQSTFQDFMSDDLAPPPNGFYDTTLNSGKRATTQNINPGDPGSGAQNVSFGDAIPAPKKAKEGASARHGRPAYLDSDVSKYPRVQMTETELKAIDPTYEKNHRRTFQDMRNSKNGTKPCRIDWDQVELLNAHRQKARHDEEERQKLCGPGEYVPKFIAADYKPKDKLQKYQNAWLEAKKKGVISDAWMNRKRRSINSRYKPVEEAENQKDGGFFGVLRSSTDMNFLSGSQMPSVQDDMRALRSYQS
ncbi:hypothetical protein OCU04_003428 [Sclerotinia nivalis]|uniref:Uncharacterized protein n=1 Tax=Sclerotinia nivalis TaxID=352851 RepID=A0A9X0DLU7_9HELO|nr:hypothetical protein OCU04_003428 [Sclerotinia nivalis]